MNDKCNVVICYSIRTPVGSFNGCLSKKGASELGAACISGILKRSKLPPEAVDEVILGNVLSANEGQGPARQAALAGGLTTSTPCVTINRVCSSGMKAIIIGAMSIIAGQNKIVLCGGMESMSQVPFYVTSHRTGQKFGHCEMVDGLLKDGLQCAFNMMSMGSCAEHTAQILNISRKMQDDYSIESYKRAKMAEKNGLFNNEIIFLDEEKEPTAEISRQSLKNNIFDEELSKVNFEKISALKPAFKRDGSITAASSSKISDGASAMLLCDSKIAVEFNLRQSGEIIGFAEIAKKPLDFATAPIDAIEKVLKKTAMAAAEIDFWEVNEAFSVVPIAVMSAFNIDRTRMNVHGGAISLGHPLGSSGARIVTSLCSVLQQHGGRYGLAAICNGGGGATAVIIRCIN